MTLPIDPADAADLADLDAALVDCRACPRLVEWRERIAREKRRAYADETYWGRPVPGFGPADARLVIIGLAPAAHGANRTGRMFTGDRSGDVLFAALHAVGVASRATAVATDDGMTLRGVRITSPVHCAPPDNKPTVDERDTCGRWLDRELTLLAPTIRAVLTLGGFGWQVALSALRDHGYAIPTPRPRFGHGTVVDLAAAPGHDVPPLRLFGCYHVSQHNTFTGRLTPAMLEDVLRHAVDYAGVS